MVRKLGLPFPQPASWRLIDATDAATCEPCGFAVNIPRLSAGEGKTMTKIVVLSRSAHGEFTECFYFEECPVPPERLAKLAESLNNRYGVVSRLVTDAYGKPLSEADA